MESRRRSSPELLRAASEPVERNGEISVRERALRANEEIFEPLARSLPSSYLRQGENPIPRTKEVAKCVSIRHRLANVQAKRTGQ